MRIQNAWLAYIHNDPCELRGFASVGLQLCALPRSRSPRPMPLDEASQSSQSFVRLSSPWKNRGDVGVERDHDGALGVPGCVLVRPRLTEVILRKNLVSTNPAGEHFSNFIFLHILSAHGV